jgi:hypothetical protein
MTECVRRTHTYKHLVRRSYFCYLGSFGVSGFQRLGIYQGVFLPPSAPSNLSSLLSAMNINSDTGLPSPTGTSDTDAQEYRQLHAVAAEHFGDGSLLSYGDPERFFQDPGQFGCPVVGPEDPSIVLMEVLMGSADGAGLHPSHREQFAATSYLGVRASTGRYESLIFLYV